MHASATPTGAHSVATNDSLSIPFLLGAAVLIGIGIVLMQAWMLTQDWPYLGSIGFLVIGGLMLLSPRTGPDRA